MFLVFLLFCSCFSEDFPAEDVVARVNDAILTKKMLGQLVGNQLGGEKELLHAANRWVEKTLLHNEAIKIGLGRDKSLIKKSGDFYKELLISSFLEIKTNSSRSVLKKDVSDYYNKNKKSFVRLGREVVVKHFVFSTKKEAESVKKTLKRNRRGEKIEKIINSYRPETVTLKDTFLKEGLVGFVFKGEPGEILGPKQYRGLYHVFEVLKKHKKGSILGLEFVYDEIYQRLYKQNESRVLASVLDSLYSSSDVFISPGVFE